MAHYFSRTVLILREPEGILPGYHHVSTPSRGSPCLKPRLHVSLPQLTALQSEPRLPSPKQHPHKRRYRQYHSLCAAHGKKKSLRTSAAAMSGEACANRHNHAQPRRRSQRTLYMRMPDSFVTGSSNVMRASYTPHSMPPGAVYCAGRSRASASATAWRCADGAGRAHIRGRRAGRCWESARAGARRALPTALGSAAKAAMEGTPRTGSEGTLLATGSAAQRGVRGRLMLSLIAGANRTCTSNISTRRLEVKRLWRGVTAAADNSRAAPEASKRAARARADALSQTRMRIQGYSVPFPTSAPSSTPTPPSSTGPSALTAAETATSRRLAARAAAARGPKAARRIVPQPRRVDARWRAMTRRTWPHGAAARRGGAIGSALPARPRGGADRAAPAAACAESHLRDAPALAALPRARSRDKRTRAGASQPLIWLLPATCARCPPWRANRSNRTAPFHRSAVVPAHCRLSRAAARMWQ